MESLRHFAAGLVILSAAALPAQTPDRQQIAPALSQAEKLFDEGNFTGVIQELLPWAQQYPDNAEIQHGLGLAYYQQQDFAGTIRHLSIALQHEEQNSAAWKQTVEILGMAEYLGNRWADAAPLLEKAAGWSPGNSTLLYSLAMSYVFTHQRDPARRAFAKLFDIPAGGAEAAMLTGDLMYQEMNGGDAESLYLEVKKKWPGYPGVEYKLGLIAITKRDYPAAVDHMKAELARYPSTPLAWHYLGEALAKLEKLDPAADAFQRAIWLNSGSVRSYVSLAQVYSEQGKFAIAESSLTQALKLEPQNYEANFLLGRLYYKTNRPELAKRQMAVAEKLRRPAVNEK